jgi:hypothetical protein
MKHLVGILLAAVWATTAYAQDPGISGNDYIQSSIKCSPNKFDPNTSKDMNNTMDMNSPLYMNNGTLGDQNFNPNSDLNSNPDNFYSRDMNIQTAANSDQCRRDAGTALKNAAQESNKGISKGWEKVKHNKLTKHLFNQPSNN